MISTESDRLKKKTQQWKHIPANSTRPIAIRNPSDNKNAEFPRFSSTLSPSPPSPQQQHDRAKERESESERCFVCGRARHSPIFRPARKPRRETRGATNLHDREGGRGSRWPDQSSRALASCWSCPQLCACASRNPHCPQQRERPAGHVLWPLIAPFNLRPGRAMYMKLGKCSARNLIAFSIREIREERRAGCVVAFWIFRGHCAFVLWRFCVYFLFPNTWFQTARRLSNLTYKLWVSTVPKTLLFCTTIRFDKSAVISGSLFDIFHDNTISTLRISHDSIFVLAFCLCTEDPTCPHIHEIYPACVHTDERLACKQEDGPCVIRYT